MKSPAWSVIHSSEDHSWRTPIYIFDALNREFSFTLDAASTGENSLCRHHITEEMDALGPTPWKNYYPGYGSIWLNPPYGRGVGNWLKRAYEESQQGHTVVCLVFASTDTHWWADWVWKAEEVRLVSGRIKFLDYTGKPRAAAPKGSAVVVFRYGHPGPPRISLWNQHRSG